MGGVKGLTATPNDVKQGLTFSRDGKTVESGRMNLSNLRPENIRDGVNINGIVGTYSFLKNGMVKCIDRNLHFDKFTLEGVRGSKVLYSEYYEKSKIVAIYWDVMITTETSDRIVIEPRVMFNSMIHSPSESSNAFLSYNNPNKINEVLSALWVPNEPMIITNSYLRVFLDFKALQGGWYGDGYGYFRCKILYV